MARRKSPNRPASTGRGSPGPVLIGDVRQAPIEVRDGNRTFRPVVALWVRADDGYVVGQLIDEPGHPAQTLLEALRTPVQVPGQPQTPVLPSRIVLFNEELARELTPMLAPLNAEVMISAPFEPFEELIEDLFAHLQQAQRTAPVLELPEDVLKALISAAERLWRARPWDYALDYPPFALVPRRDNGRPLYASILGANEEVFGVALYTSLEDYETAVMLGETGMGPPEDMSPEALDVAATKVLEALRRRAFLVSFDPKGDVPSGYREQLALGGWPGRLSKVPTFAALGGGQEPALLSVEEAAQVALAVDALVTFCDRHRKRIADEQFPIRDAVQTSLMGKSALVDVSVPAEDPSAPPATVYRLKVSLTYQKEIWRTIDVRSDQTLEDLHYAIQEAFGWDDDHLYAFYLSGKAWDRSTEFVRPEARGPGERSAQVRLDRLGLRSRKRFLYIFDFGDEWRHDIRVEKAGLPTDGSEYPRIVEEHGEAPPQYGDLDEEEEVE